jgi:hypothetical protein
MLDKLEKVDWNVMKKADLMVDTKISEMNVMVA